MLPQGSGDLAHRRFQAANADRSRETIEMYRFALKFDEGCERYGWLARLPGWVTVTLSSPSSQSAERVMSSEPLVHSTVSPRDEPLPVAWKPRGRNGPTKPACTASATCRYPRPRNQGCLTFNTGHRRRTQLNCRDACDRCRAPTGERVAHITWQRPAATITAIRSVIRSRTAGLTSMGSRASGCARRFAGSPASGCGLRPVPTPPARYEVPRRHHPRPCL